MMCWMTITCPKCAKESSLDDMTYRPLTGWLPPGQFQCPHCNHAFQRKEVTAGHTFIHRGEVDYIPGNIGLVPCDAVL